jgi:hypothetical protein
LEKLTIRGKGRIVIKRTEKILWVHLKKKVNALACNQMNALGESKIKKIK